MCISINEIKERVRFLKEEQKKSGEGDPVLKYLIETPNTVGMAVKIDQNHDLAILAANFAGLGDSFLIGYIPEEYAINEDNLTKYLSFFSDEKIAEKSTFVIQGENEPTKIATRIDQEMLENIDEWFSTMVVVCGLLICESFSQSWEN